MIRERADITYILVLKRSSGSLASIMKALEMSQGPPNELVAYDAVVLAAPAGGWSGIMMASAHMSPDSFTQGATDPV